MVEEDSARAPEHSAILRDHSGFTLIELVLATLISSLVVGILAVCLSFTLRTWEREQDRKQSDMPALIHLLKMQLANFDPMAVTIDGQQGIFFQGDERALSFCTDHSVKAINRGVPVVVRYIFSPEDKRLYYAEIPANPYHFEPVTEFLQLQPKGGDDQWPRFYAVDVADFSISYGGEEAGNLEGAWSDILSIPKTVVVKWITEAGTAPFSTFLIPNCLFSRSMPKKPGMIQTPGLGNTRRKTF